MAANPDRLKDTYSQWFQEYSLPLFATLTLTKTYRPRRGDFKSAHRSIGMALKKLGKETGVTVAAIGFIVVSPANHVHSHLLVGGEGALWQDDSSTMAKLIDQIWRFNSVSQVAKSVEDVARYMSDDHHLVASKSHDLFTHGPDVLNRIRRGGLECPRS